MKPGRTVLVAVALALAFPFVAQRAQADQVVIVRELRTPPGAPLGGVGRVVRRVDGARVREEVSLAPEARPDAAADARMEITAIWSAEDRVWREWAKGQDTFDEMSEDSLARMSNGSDEMTANFSELFGTGEEVVQDVSLAVDSSAVDSTIAGVPVRRRILRADGRYYRLEKNAGGEVSFVRTVWMAPAIPGVGPGVPRLQDGPSCTMTAALAGIQLLAFPMFHKAVDQLDAEVGKLPGQRMRDELRIEAPADSGKAAASMLVYEDKVLEVRAEPSQPALYALPPGLHRREPASPGVGHIEHVAPPSRRTR